MVSDSQEEAVYGKVYLLFVWLSLALDEVGSLDTFLTV